MLDSLIFKILCFIIMTSVCMLSLHSFVHLSVLSSVCLSACLPVCLGICGLFFCISSLYASSLRKVPDEEQAAVHSFYDELRETYLGSGIQYAMRLSAFDLFKPWDSYLLTRGSGGFNTGDHVFQNMSEMILIPSPGEDIPINITTWDQVWNSITAAVTFRVRQRMRSVNFQMPCFVLRYSGRLIIRITTAYQCYFLFNCPVFYAMFEANQQGHILCLTDHSLLRAVKNNATAVLAQGLL